MTCCTRLVALVWLAFAIGTVSCGSDTPQGSGGGAGSGGRADSSGSGGASGSAGSGVPSRGPIADAGSSIVIVGGSGGAAGAAGAPAGMGGAAGAGGTIGGGGAGGDGGPTLPICPDGVRGNDIACDSSVDVICISDCLNNSRIRCGCTSRGMGQGQGDDRWVCGGQPQDCQ